MRHGQWYNQRVQVFSHNSVLPVANIRLIIFVSMLSARIILLNYIDNYNMHRKKIFVKHGLCNFKLEVNYRTRLFYKEKKRADN